MSTSSPSTPTNENNDTNNNIPSLAIIGGGIAGLTLTLALLPLHTAGRLHLTLYEASGHFGEIGAGVAFGPSATRAMSLIAPALRAGFERRATRNGSPAKRDVWFDFRLGDTGHPAYHAAGTEAETEARDDDDDYAGPLICTLRCPDGAGNVHRAHFLDELVRLLPPEWDIARFGKRLTDVRPDDDNSRKVRLTFADGSHALHDAVVGCDGIKSRTRVCLLNLLSQSSDPAAAAEAAEPVFSGKYAYRGLVPMDDAVAILGDERARNAQMYLGRGGHVLTFPIDHGRTLNVVAFTTSPDPPTTADRWIVPATRADLARDFAAWSPPVRALLARLAAPTDRWALFDHPPAPTYHQGGAIVLAGDAAHATTPHQGSGAGMAVEDGCVLAALVAEVFGKDEGGGGGEGGAEAEAEAEAGVQARFERAFAAYERVRKARTQRVVTTSREAGRLYDLELTEEVEEIRRNLEGRMGWIWDEDVAEEIRRGKELLGGAAGKVY